jgi:excisionase family DNA binding protein
MQDMIDDDVYLRTAEAAKILHVSAKTVSRWAKEGKIPHVVTLGGHRRFPATAVQDLARRLSIS